MQSLDSEQQFLRRFLQIVWIRFTRPIALEHAVFTEDDICIFSLSVKIGCNLGGSFGRYCRSPSGWKDSFVLAAMSNELEKILNAVSGVTSYRCSCGFMYVIGECGKPTAAVKCKQCPRTIDGSNHVFAENSQQKLQTIPNDRTG